MNCPINEMTADGDVVGRCWFHLPDGCTCPRHGNVSAAVKRFEDERKLTLETEHDPGFRKVVKRNQEQERRRK